MKNRITAQEARLISANNTVYKKMQSIYEKINHTLKTSKSKEVYFLIDQRDYDEVKKLLLLDGYAISIEQTYTLSNEYNVLITW